MADQQQHRPVGWLFQHLEKCVGRVGVKLIGGIDHHDPPAAFAGRQPHKIAGLPDPADRYGAPHPIGLGIEFPFEGNQIRMAARGYPPKNGVLGFDVKSVGRWRRLVAKQTRALVSIRLPIGENEAGYAKGKGRLADAARAGNQPAMRHPPRSPTRQKPLLRSLVSEKLGITAGRERIFALLVGCHSYSTSGNRSATALRIALATSSWAPDPSITTHRAALALAIERNASRSRR
jgi:hypothetical protein